jgi:hypothetical protein
MHALKVALPPKCEALRKTWQGPRGTTKYISSNANEDNTTALRLQRLKLLGIIGQRADVLSSMIWEARHG